MSFDYQMMVPPVGTPSFDAMTQSQAREHFAWFMQQARNRIEQLKRAYAYEVGSSDDLDDTRDSLVPLWRWLSRHAKERPLSTGEVEQRRSQLPQWAKEAGVTAGELSAPSLALAVDAGFYLANVFLTEHPGEVEWVLWEKQNDRHHNHPVLTGFGSAPLLPHEPVVNAMWGAIHGRKDDDRVAKIYDVWARKLDRRPR